VLLVRGATANEAAREGKRVDPVKVVMSFTTGMADVEESEEREGCR